MRLFMWERGFNERHISGGTASCNEALAVDPRCKLPHYVSHTVLSFDPFRKLWPLQQQWVFCRPVKYRSALYNTDTIINNISKTEFYVLLTVHPSMTPGK